ncbi:SCO family protein [Thalassotalea maritima]|uniref:SCO family protein n=1 Tax=Thalassotalea maritima TaxID=3242416 RepID=UPI0035276EC5
MNKVLFAIIALVAIATGAFVYQSQFQQQQPKHALMYQTPRTLAKFELTDHHGRAFSNEQLLGKWTLFFFGYTSCPDICPITMQKLNSIYPELQQVSGNNMQVALITADPKRDSVEVLSEYVKYFNKDFLALRAGHDVLFPFSRNLGLMYAIAEDSEDEYYLVNHSASIVMTNPNGQVHAIFKPIQGEPGVVPSINADAMLADFKLIYQQSQ